MTIYNLDKIFKPGSVAIIGASDKEGSIGYALMNNLKEGDTKEKSFRLIPATRW